jgi:hypothetical protein
MHASDTSTKIDISGASINVRDLSGDGVTFYYPTWDDFATLHASGMNPVTIGNFTSTKQYFVTFGIDITNHGADTTKVFINSSAGLAAVDSATNTASTPAMQSTRVAIWDCGTGSDPTTLKTIWQYSDAGKGTGYTYLAKGETSDTAYNVSGYKLATPETATFHEGPFSAPSYTTTTAGQLIHTFAHVDEVAHLTVMMWIEGTLTTALDACIGGIVSLSLPVIAFDPGL